MILSCKQKALDSRLCMNAGNVLLYMLQPVCFQAVPIATTHCSVTVDLNGGKATGAQCEEANPEQALALTTWAFYRRLNNFSFAS